MKHEAPDDAEGHGESSQGWPPRLFDEIVDLLAEALVLDYQGISDRTVNSPQGNDHSHPLTSNQTKGTIRLLSDRQSGDQLA